ncbi:Universal stress protein family [Polaromonas sp. CG9_12]|uniref:universal stress protein n=1 Tax=Polaromonas sp. CG_9.11 TaxID=2787730 RepID=UPI0004DDD74F|nr:universal stress protein [Polaromonas sp. CG_9.11]MBG6076153.1 nucleotide-binding universal stress UspA family protein [Polaromonas sp. CG_9.11]CDS49731.1 Universal stress protein family [Polaromonas sp. CG9_12]
MFKHILVPVDGSAAAHHAVHKARAIACAFRSSVTLIHVIDCYAFTGMGADIYSGQSDYLRVATLEANEAIVSAREVFEAQGMLVNGSVVEGHSVYQTILEAAETLDADLLVMGSHGRRGLEKLVLGSVTAQVLSHAHLPVLVVRDEGT